MDGRWKTPLLFFNLCERSMKNTIKTSLVAKVLLTLGVIILTGLLIYEQIHVHFMLDDLDYGCNLVTGEEVSSLSDVFQSLGPMYFEEGGSLIAQFWLQINILLGEAFANVMNTAVLLLVPFLICLAIGADHQRFFFVAFPYFLLISLNSDWINSYMWQFGTISYFYPAIWMLIFLRFYNKVLDDLREQPSWPEGILITVSGFLAGWGNGAYGMLCIGIAGFSMLLERFLLKGRIKRRMIGGLFGAVLGTLLYLTAPGNFQENGIIHNIYLNLSIYPAVVLALTMLAILMRIGGWLHTSQVMMLGTLAWGIFLTFVVGWIPQIGANGILVATMVFGITFFCSLFFHTNNSDARYRNYAYVLAGITFLIDIMGFAEHFVGVV